MEIDGVVQYYCRPIWHPVLSDFCVELTGIQQSMVDAAPTYPEAVQMMQNTFGKNALKSNTWVSWGDYDRMMFEHMRDHVWGTKVPPCGAEANWFKNLYPFGRRHANLKNLHGLLSGVPQERSVQGALVTIGEKFEGKPHCGKDDAFNIAKILRHIIRENRSKLVWWNM